MIQLKMDPFSFFDLKVIFYEKKMHERKNEVKFKLKSCRALTSASPLAITCTGDALCNGKESKNNSMAKNNR